MNRDTTPVTITLPAYMLRPVFDALKWRAIRLRTRARNRPSSEGKDGADYHIAGTLAEASMIVSDALRGTL